MEMHSVKKAGLTLLKMALTALIGAPLLHLLKVENFWIFAAVVLVLDELISWLLNLLLNKKS